MSAHPLVGKRVRIEFNPLTWPIHAATYIYEGHDHEGYFVRRKDGTQRYFLRRDVTSITPVDEVIPENEY